MALALAPLASTHASLALRVQARDCQRLINVDVRPEVRVVGHWLSRFAPALDTRLNTSPVAVTETRQVHARVGVRPQCNVAAGQEAVDVDRPMLTFALPCGRPVDVEQELISEPALRRRGASACCERRAREKHCHDFSHAFKKSERHATAVRHDDANLAIGGNTPFEHCHPNGACAPQSTIGTVA
jgi:hypothetical protein